MGELQGRRILVVEDEALVAMLLEDALMDAGCTILGPGSSVEQSLSILQHNRPDAAVIDLNLAGESSGPVADALAAMGVPFLVATGYGAEGLPKGHENVPVLTKPYDPGELIEMLAQLCDARAPG